MNNYGRKFMQEKVLRTRKTVYILFLYLEKSMMPKMNKLDNQLVQLHLKGMSFTRPCLKQTSLWLHPETSSILGYSSSKKSAFVYCSNSSHNTSRQSGILVFPLVEVWKAIKCLDWCEQRPFGQQRNESSVKRISSIKTYRATMESFCLLWEQKVVSYRYWDKQKSGFGWSIKISKMYQ